MTTYRPAQIFASINTNPQAGNKPKKPVEGDCGEMPTKTTSTRENEIQVNATGEISLAPDRCRVTFGLSSAKEHAQEAKNSVSRRLDYITQTLHNHQVKEGDITISKVMRRVDRVYHLDAEVTVVFVDFSKCQTVCNFLVEKLDESVKVSPPEFYQSPQRLENLRRQASLTAVKNAKVKAAEIAQFLQATVGKPIAIREESCNEWDGPGDGSYDPDTPMTIQQRQALATVTVSVKVSASFELRPKGRTKQAKH